MNYHTLLEEQIRKYFPEKADIPDSCRELLASISNSYETFDKARLSATLNKEIIKSLLPPQAGTEYPNTTDRVTFAKSDFLSLMSHGIRTPLNAIVGIAHLMMNDELPLSQLENIRTLNISAENLLILINDILDYNKLEEGKIKLNEKNTDLRQLMNSIKSANRFRSEERGNQLKVMLDADLPRFVKADDIRLTQILNNLLSNAIKFTHNGIIKLEVKLVSDSDTYSDVRFEVTDTGIGIKKEKQQFIFEYFSRAAMEIIRESNGSGLGLAITRRLLHLMQTDIEVRSEPGAGTSFSFVLRLNKGDEMVSDVKPEKGMIKNDLGGIKVLLVEDVEFNVMVAEKMLLNWNARVEVSENGLCAIGKVRDGNFDLILMDLQMPVLDGYSATKHIREFNSEIPIIALTASASSDVHQKTKDVGMNGYVSKPFKPADLYDTIYEFAIRRKAS